ncbi:MAG: hypothetical protein IPH93_01225 [Saprospiraceae bacterium]|nr:hypothetical protein [Saprospiraceae bacterium]
MKKIIIPGTIPTGELHQYLLGSVAPRPIAFVSTIDEFGRTNLAPYSFLMLLAAIHPFLYFLPTDVWKAIPPKTLCTTSWPPKNVSST